MAIGIGELNLIVCKQIPVGCGWTLIGDYLVDLIHVRNANVVTLIKLS